MLVEDWYLRAYQLTEDDALEILKTHRHFWKNFDRFFGILYPLSDNIFLHKGFREMFRNHLDDWLPAISQTTFLIVFSDSKLELFEALVTLLPKKTILLNVVNHQKPFLKCFQLLLAHGYTIAEMDRIILQSCKNWDVEMIQWIADNNLEKDCFGFELIKQCVMRRNIATLERCYSHPLMDVQLLRGLQPYPSTIVGTGPYYNVKVVFD